MTDIDDPRFTLKQVALATAGNANTIFSWFQRGHFQLSKVDKRGELGLAHAISFRTAFEIAIAVELYRRCRLHPSAGAQMARSFTREGDAKRNPGELFKKGHTVLVAYPEAESALVLNMTKTTPLIDVFDGIGNGRQIAATVIWLDFIDRDLRVALLQDGSGSRA